MTADELLGRRLIFTVGKGGVGRTTVALALGLEAVRRGRHVLLVELEGARALEHALEEQRAANEPPPGIERISYQVVDGKRALEEYLALIIPVRRLLKTIFSTTVYQYFVAAAPGLKELMTVGKIWYEAERKVREAKTRATADSGGPDVVVVDAPATGHSLQYLRMPQAALDTFKVGLVHREAERVVSLLRDPKATAVVIVTTAEEMPTNETRDIHRGLSEIGLLSAALVVNQVHETPCTTPELEALRTVVPESPRLAAPKDAGRKLHTGQAERLFGEVLACAEEEHGWAAINAANVARLAVEVPIPTVRLPFLFSEEFGPEQVLRLARDLASQLDAHVGRAARVARSR